ncbi:DUF3303 domain-containing protein [Geodermatophilus sp. SYSU D01105]
MRYVVTWQDRPTGSIAEYEAAHERILDVLTREMPESLRLREAVVRLGDFGGHAVIEADEPSDLHALTAVYAPFNVTVAPVVDAVAAGQRDPEPQDALQRTGS